MVRRTNNMAFNKGFWDNQIRPNRFRPSELKIYPSRYRYGKGAYIPQGDDAFDFRRKESAIQQIELQNRLLQLQIQQMQK